MANTPYTMSIPEAGAYFFGLGKNASYKAAKEDNWPIVFATRKKQRVVIKEMERKILESCLKEAK